MRMLLSFTWLLFGAAATACFGIAPSKCQLKVFVVDDLQRDIDATIRVVEKSGRVHEAENDVGGVEFCDLGILPVRVEVGRKESCSFTTVDNVWLEYGEQAVLRVLRNIDHCNVTMPRIGPPRCKVMIRVRGAEDDVGLADFEVSSDSKSAHPFVSAGRVYLEVLLKLPVRIEVRKAGFVPAAVRADCGGSLERRELEIRMKAVPAAREAGGLEKR
jgi:hypothetical protein